MTEQKGTRGRIVEMLHRDGEATIALLSARLGVTPAALRRHLDILAGDGTVQYRTVKQATGRPYFVYRLTEQAHEAAVGDYPRLLERLVTELSALGPEQTGGHDGRDLLELVFSNMSDGLAAQYHHRVQGETLAERVASLTEALRDEGIVERWEQRDDGFHLIANGCPHRRAAMAAHGLCSSEARAISLLLGAEVEPLGRVVDGAPVCEYLVRPTELSDTPAARDHQPAPVTQPPVRRAPSARAVATRGASAR